MFTGLLIGASGVTAVYTLWLVRRLFTTAPVPTPASTTSSRRCDPVTETGASRRQHGPHRRNAAPDAPRRNRPRFDDLPVPDDTANLREGPDLHPLCTGLLPLVGVWRGAGEIVEPDADDRSRSGSRSCSPTTAARSCPTSRAHGCSTTTAGSPGPARARPGSGGRSPTARWRC